jgi:hypothetical protein
LYLSRAICGADNDKMCYALFSCFRYLCDKVEKQKIAVKFAALVADMMTHGPWATALHGA